MEKKVLNLKEKVYLLLYYKPNYKANISKIIYGKESKSINRIWNDLCRDNWIKPKKTKVNRVDGRSWSQKNYITNAEPFLNSMRNDLDNLNDKLSLYNKKIEIKLTSDEELLLLNFLSCDIFKTYINNLIKHIEITYGLQNQYFNLNNVKNRLSDYCSFLLFNEMISAAIKAKDNTKSMNYELTKIFKKHGAIKNIINMKESTLLLGYKLVEKISYLDFINAITLFSNFKKMFRTFGTLTYHQLLLDIFSKENLLSL